MILYQIYFLSENKDDSFAKGPSIFTIFHKVKSDAILERLAGITSIDHTGLMYYDQDESKHCLQVLSPGVDKQSGIEELILHLPNTRKLVIGDGRNDIPAFAAVGPDDIRVAIDNPDTPEELKDLANWIAPSVYEDGFAVAMERYRLI